MKFKPAVDYNEWLYEQLKDPELASGYLNDALKEGDKDGFLLALKQVLIAQGGMMKISDKTKMNRVSLYKMLSKNGNPGLENIMKLLQTAGVRFQIVPKSFSKRKKAA